MTERTESKTAKKPSIEYRIWRGAGVKDPNGCHVCGEVFTTFYARQHKDPSGQWTTDAKGCLDCMKSGEWVEARVWEAERIS